MNELEIVNRGAWSFTKRAPLYLMILLLPACNRSCDPLGNSNSNAQAPSPSATAVPCPVTQVVYQNNFSGSPVGDSLDFGRADISGGNSPVYGATINTQNAYSLSVPNSLGIHCNSSSARGATIFRNIVGTYCNDFKMTYSIQLDSIPGEFEAWLHGVGVIVYDPVNTQIYTWVGTTKTILATGVSFNGWVTHTIWCHFDNAVPGWKHELDLGGMGAFGPYPTAGVYSYGSCCAGGGTISYAAGQSNWDSQWFGWTVPHAYGLTTVYLDDVLVEAKQWPF